MGIIPGTFAFVYFGNALSTQDYRQIVGALVLVLLVGVLGRFLIKRNLSHKNNI
jgi:uncharacterized membrane protein YdjX (TVP38/TMEM64 family)